MSTDSVKVGRRIREIRRAQGVSVQSISTQTGLSRESIARIESGNANPVLDTLSRIATALGVSTAALLEAAPDDASADDERAIAAGREGGALVQVPHPRTRLSTRSSVSLMAPEGALEAMWSDAGLYWPIELPPSDTPQLLRVFAWGQQLDDQPSLYYGHHEDEFLIVIDGALDVIVANRTYRLEAGDSVHLVGTQPHQFVRAGDGPARIISMLLPPAPADTTTPTNRHP